MKKKKPIHISFRKMELYDRRGRGLHIDGPMEYIYSAMKKADKPETEQNTKKYKL